MNFSVALRLMLEKGAKIRRKTWQNGACYKLTDMTMLLQFDDARANDWETYGDFDSSIIFEEAQKENTLLRVEKRLDKIEKVLQIISENGPGD